VATYRKFPKYIVIFVNNEGARYLKKKTPLLAPYWMHSSRIPENQKINHLQLVMCRLGLKALSWMSLGIGTGNPEVFQGYLHLYPRKPVPVPKGTGFNRYRYGFSRNPEVCNLVLPW
jgi:hypothetical protein